MINLYTDRDIEIIKSWAAEEAVDTFIKEKVPEIERRAVEDFQVEQEKFASVVDDQPKVVWNDEPAYFNFPCAAKVISITRESYGTESEYTLVSLLFNGNIAELRYGVSREVHKELVKHYVAPSTTEVVSEKPKKKKK